MKSGVKTKISITVKSIFLISQDDLWLMLTTSRTHEKWSQDKNLHYREIDFFDFTGRPLANADYLTHT